MTVLVTFDNQYKIKALSVNKEAKLLCPQQKWEVMKFKYFVTVLK